jgi:hypothetical protein
MGYEPIFRTREFPYISGLNGKMAIRVANIASRGRFSDIHRLELQKGSVVKNTSKNKRFGVCELRSGRFSELRLCGSVLGSISTMIYHPGTGKGGIPGGTEETRLHNQGRRNNRRGLGPVEVK